MPISQLSKRPCKFQDKKISHPGMPDFNSHSMKVKHVSSPWPSDSTPRNLHKRNGCISQQNKVLGDFHSSFTHNRNKTRTWQQPKYPSTKEWINKLGNSYKWRIYYWAKKKTTESHNHTKVTLRKETRYQMLISFIQILSKWSKAIRW